jgi:hypothetical protein
MNKTLQSISTKTVKKQITNQQVSSLASTLHQFCQTEFHPVPNSDFCGAVLSKDGKTNWLQLHFVSGIRVDLEKAVPWWFKANQKELTGRPILSISLVGAAGQSLQLEELDARPNNSSNGLTRNDRMAVYRTDRLDRPVGPWSLTSTLPAPYPAIFQQGNFRVMLAVEPEALRDTRQINVKLRQQAP